MGRVSEHEPDDIQALLAFLDARLGEDEAAAWSLHDVTRCEALLYEEDMADAARRQPDCDCGMPARALREVRAKRELISLALENASETDNEWGDGHDPCELATGLCSDHGLTAALRNLAPLASIWEVP